MTLPTGRPFISYAQNFEDVMLWRALKHVQTGFYVDVGAGSPRDDSVTLAFYERGWHGINLEPNPTLYAQLVTERPRDLNLNVAVADVPGTAVMNFFDDTGLSTLDPSVARRHVAEGRVPRPGNVAVETLTSVLATHVPSGSEIHFLKVDVEGFEGQVLSGNRWTTNRPWIVLVESTPPLLPDPSHQAWEPVLTDAKYAFVYADGLNRFYLADEHRDLISRFEYPPNFFDNFELARISQAQARAVRAEAQIESIYASRSWRATRPLRAAMHLGRLVGAASARLVAIGNSVLRPRLARILDRGRRRSKLS